MQALQDVQRRVDQVQKQQSFLGFLIGVVKKFGDDQAGYLAALVAYYAFFSIFPLLLVFATVLGFVLQNNRGLRDRIINTVQNNFPGIGAFNFVMQGALGGGVTRSLSLDPHGKSLSYALLEMNV